jgi:hypothetical protein
MKLAPVALANNKQVNFIENSHVAKVAIRAGVNQEPPMHQLRMSLFNPFCG